jgi:hypothetical protein
LSPRHSFSQVPKPKPVSMHTKPDLQSLWYVQILPCPPAPAPSQKVSPLPAVSLAGRQVSPVGQPVLGMMEQLLVQRS